MFHCHFFPVWCINGQDIIVPGVVVQGLCAHFYRGDFLQSFVYHPVVMYGAVLYVWFMVSHTIEYLTRGRWRIGMQYTDKYLYGAVGIILAQWVVKNAVKAIWGVGI